MTDGDNGPVGDPILPARSRDVLRYERQMRWESIPWVPDGVGEVVGQKVDNIATIVQPGVCVRNDRDQPIPVGVEKVLTECAQVFLVYQRRISVVHGFPRPNLFDDRIITPAVR